MENYIIHYSDPIWPKEEDTAETLMNQVLSIFEKTIEDNPSQWLWIHNRWKQSLPGPLPKRLRQEAIAFIFPSLSIAKQTLPSFRQIYPHEFLTAFLPSPTDTSSLPQDIEFKFYKDLSDILTTDYRFKLVYDFTHNHQIKKHFLSLSAFHVETPTSCQDIIKLVPHAS